MFNETFKADIVAEPTKVEATLKGFATSLSTPDLRDLAAFALIIMQTVQVCFKIFCLMARVNPLLRSRQSVKKTHIHASAQIP